MKNEIIIEKVSGDKEKFNERKLRTSLERVDVPGEKIAEMIDEINKTFSYKTTTEEIHRFVEHRLKSKYKKSAMRYSLKKALLAFGPSGYPFEDYVGEVFNKQGFNTEIGVIINGRCISHEVDVIASKDKVNTAIEVKFHNQQRFKTDVKTALYVKSRFDDLKNKTDPFAKKIHQGILVTNSHFTHNAIRYSECAGLGLIGWSYPNGNAMRDLIEKFSVHPVTCLSSLNQNERNLLFNRRIVLCSDILNEKKYLSSIGISKEKIDILVDESELLCS